MLKQLTKLFNRDIDRFINEIRSFPKDKIWEKAGSVENPAGILAQHTAGNLHHYIGHGMGNVSYKRHREREFSNTGADKSELIDILQEAQQAVDKTLSEIDTATLKSECSQDFPVRLNNEELLLQLYGHLNYHLGQINYLRRFFIEE